MTGADTLTLEIARFPAASAFLGLRVVEDPDSYVEFTHTQGELTAVVVVDGMELGSVSAPNLDTDTGQVWRLAQDDGDLLLATSSNGADFGDPLTVRMDGEIDLSAVAIMLSLIGRDQATEAELGGVNADP